MTPLLPVLAQETGRLTWGAMPDLSRLLPGGILCVALLVILVADLVRGKGPSVLYTAISAAGPNMFALVALQKHVADALGLPCGPYTHISLVPHIYYIRDMTDLQAFCRDGADIQPAEAVCAACGRGAGKAGR